MNRTASQPMLLLAGVVLLWLAGRSMMMYGYGAEATVVATAAEAGVLPGPVITGVSPARSSSARSDLPDQPQWLLAERSMDLPASEQLSTMQGNAPLPAVGLVARQRAVASQRIGTIDIGGDPQAKWPLPRHDPVASDTALVASNSVAPATNAMAPPKPGSLDRWTVSGWAYVRPGRQQAARFDLASLGGSQIGIRATRSIDRTGRVRLFGRLTSSGAIGDGAEGGVGLSVQPIGQLPIAIVVERREQLVGRGGRSAFAAFISGGLSDRALGRGIMLNGYGAAGVVGAERRDLFVEGSTTLSHPLKVIDGIDLAAGAGVWGAAQPGASRVDIGPRLSARLPLGGVRPLMAVDWRQRVAGGAAPSSGIALTLAADF